MERAGRKWTWMEQNQTVHQKADWNWIRSQNTSWSGISDSTRLDLNLVDDKPWLKSVAKNWCGLRRQWRSDMSWSCTEVQMWLEAAKKNWFGLKLHRRSNMSKSCREDRPWPTAEIPVRQSSCTGTARATNYWGTTHAGTVVRQDLRVVSGE